MTVDWSSYSSWDLVLPPNRPSEELLQAISLALATAADVKAVCILGSTPEYRLLCYKLEISQVIIIDKSEVFSNQCDGYTVCNSRETKVFGDWLSILPKFTNQFDVVLSHLTHGNIQFDHRSIFFELIRKSLKPGGLLIDFVFQPLAPGYSLKTIVSRFQDRPANIRTYNDFNSIALFQSEIIGALGCVDTSAIYSFLDNSTIPDTVKLIVAGTKKITPPGYIWHYSFDKPPSSFGFSDGYNVVATLPEPAGSAFFNVAALCILRKH